MKKTIPELQSEVSDLHKEIVFNSPRLKEAMKSYHLIRDHQAQLIQLHREKQKELKLLQGDIKILPSHTSTKKSLNKKAMKPSEMINLLSAEDKKRLRAELLGE